MTIVVVLRELRTGFVVVYWLRLLGLTVSSQTQNSVKKKYINDVAFPLTQVLMETDDAGTMQAVYTYGNDLISITASGATAYYHCDGLGTTRQITDNTGALTASYIFDGYGNLFDTTGTIDNSYGFTGEQQLNEADSFVFLRARYYDTKTGRFISRDPMLSLDHYAPLGNYLPYALKTFTRLKPSLLNLYVYCFNNPINSLDPNGEKPVKLIGWLWKWIKLIFWSKKTCDIEKNDPKPVCPDKSEYENQADYDTAELEYLLELKKWERRRIEKCKDAAVEAGDIIY